MNSTVSTFCASDSVSRRNEMVIGNVEYKEIWLGTAQREKCIAWIRDNGYKKICLQFPDGYLCHSEKIAKDLRISLKEWNTRTDIFILGDTSYGNCCVDEIAAAHVDGDSIVHFGDACRSKTTRLPVFYCFPQFHMDCFKFYQQLLIIQNECVGIYLTIYLDIGYHHLINLPQFVNMKRIEEINSELVQHLSKLSTKEIQIICYSGDYCAILRSNGEFVSYESSSPKCLNGIVDERICIFVGNDNRRFFNLLLSTKATKWFIYNPLLDRLEEKNSLLENYIKRRFYYIEKCKDALTLGIIVATLTVEGYLDVVKRLQMLARRRGVKTHIIYVGRINSSKLANFFDIDCFIAIGCPFNDIYESREFYKPVISVFDAELALNPDWHMRYPDTYVTNFKQLLSEDQVFVNFGTSDCMDVSLITNKNRNSVDKSMSDDDNKDVQPNKFSLLGTEEIMITKPRMELMTSYNGLTFENRTWCGLDPSLSINEPAKLQKGLTGVPNHYVQID